MKVKGDFDESGVLRLQHSMPAAYTKFFTNATVSTGVVAAIAATPFALGGLGSLAI